MAQPLRSRLRAARRSGLTSPDPVRIPDAARQPASQPRPEAPDKPQNRQRQAKHALKALIDENHSHKASRSGGPGHLSPGLPQIRT
jgi:hypothetical protein